MFEFLKRMFAKKEVPQTVAEPPQPTVVDQPISTPLVETAPAVKKVKSQKKKDVNNITAQSSVWPFEGTPQPTKKKVAQKKTTTNTAAAITAKQSTKKSRKKKDA